MSFKPETKSEWHGREVMQDFDTMNFKALYESASIVEAEAIALAPVDTSNLKKSITKNVKKDTATIGTNVFYAIYVELGTRFQKAQSFLLPSLTGNIRKIIAVFKKQGIALKWVHK